MAIYKLLDPKGNVVQTGDDKYKSEMERMGLAAGYTFVADTKTTKETIIDRLASKGNEKAKEAQKNNYSVVTQAQKGEKPLSEFNPEQSAERINNFNSALNVAIDQARQQRKDSVLDLVGGFAPAGALPATSFAGVLTSVNASSAPLEASLITGASNHARDMEQFKANEAVRVEEQAEADKQYIRDLAITVATETGDVTTAQLIMTHADRDGAVKAALTALGDEYYAQDGAIKQTSSKEGEEDRIISEFKTNLPDSGHKKYFDPTLNALWEAGEQAQEPAPSSDLDFIGLNNKGTYSTHINVVKAEGKRLMGAETYKKIDESKGMTDEWMREFLNDWLALQEQTGQKIDAWKYYNDLWYGAKKEVTGEKDDDDELTFEALYKK